MCPVPKTTTRPLSSNLEIEQTENTPNANRTIQKKIKIKVPQKSLYAGMAFWLIPERYVSHNCYGNTFFPHLQVRLLVGSGPQGVI